MEERDSLNHDETAEDIVIKVEPICYDMKEDTVEDTIENTIEDTIENTIEDTIKNTKDNNPSTSKAIEEETTAEPLQEFQCPICKKIKKDARDLKSHSRIHTRNHACPHCEDRFFCKTSDLHLHLRTNHGDNSRAKSFICEICGNSFTEAYALTKHKRNLHDGIKLHACTFCPSMFKDSDSKKAHERRHTGEKPYQCTECEKSFARRNSLRMHMRWHQGNLSFKCSICDLLCDKQSRLQSHMISHTKERAFECDICHIRLARKSSIRPHKLSVHNVVVPWKHELQGKTPEESADKPDVSLPFECPVCHKVLKSRKPSHINRHLAIHKTHTPYKCIMCHKEYKEEQYLKVHMRKAHRQIAAQDSMSSDLEEECNTSARSSD